MKIQTTLSLAAALGLGTNACLLKDEIEHINHLKDHGIPETPTHSSKFRKADYDPGFTGIPVSTGDRFKNGTVIPRGLSTQDRDLKSILNGDEIDSALRGLATYKGVKMFTAPLQTVEKRSMHGIVIGNGEPRVYIEGGIHARERGGPDHIVYFLADLLQARDKGTGLTYGNNSYTNNDVVKALSAGIVTMPLVNPDGVAYDQKTGYCWRKNRNRKSAEGEWGIGVDLNRNFDAVWNYTKYFSADAETHSSDIASSETFHGTAAMSEIENQNIGWLMKQHTKLSWFLDLHSTGGDILYGWGDDNTQTTDPSQSFTNPAYDGKRGIIGDKEYKEFIEAADINSQLATAKRMSHAMGLAGNISYAPKAEAALYPSSGGSTDYFLSQYYGKKCGANRVQGLAIEFGEESGLECPFYPTNAQYHISMRQVGSGLMELLLAAAGKEGELKTYKC